MQSIHPFFLSHSKHGATDITTPVQQLQVRQELLRTSRFKLVLYVFWFAGAHLFTFELWVHRLVFWLIGPALTLWYLIDLLSLIKFVQTRSRKFPTTPKTLAA